MNCGRLELILTNRSLFLFLPYSLSNPTEMTFEDCNIFGADGSEDPTLQHQHTSSSNPNLTCNR